MNKDTKDQFTETLIAQYKEEIEEILVECEHVYRLTIDYDLLIRLAKLSIRVGDFVTCKNILNFKDLRKFCLPNTIEELKRELLVAVANGNSHNSQQQQQQQQNASSHNSNNEQRISPTTRKQESLNLLELVTNGRIATKHTQQYLTATISTSTSANDDSVNTHKKNSSPGELPNKSLLQADQLNIETQELNEKNELENNVEIIGCNGNNNGNNNTNVSSDDPTSPTITTTNITASSYRRSARSNNTRNVNTYKHQSSNSNSTTTRSDTNGNNEDGKVNDGNLNTFDFAASIQDIIQSLPLLPLLLSNQQSQITLIIDEQLQTTENASIMITDSLIANEEAEVDVNTNNISTARTAEIVSVSTSTSVLEIIIEKLSAFNTETCGYKELAMPCITSDSDSDIDNWNEISLYPWYILFLSYTSHLVI